MFRIYTNILRRILRGYWNFGTNVSGWRKIKEEDRRGRIDRRKIEIQMKVGHNGVP